MTQTSANTTPTNIISYSLWGCNKRYIDGLALNLSAAMEYYPGWLVCVFAHDECYEEVVRLKREYTNLKVYRIQLKTGWSGLLWRFLPCQWRNCQHVIVRDLDSVLTCREKEAVETWIASGRALHIMRDHPAHAMPIMGGMFGVKPSDSSVARAFKRLKTLILDSQCHRGNDFWQMDQIYLATDVFPALRDKSLIHDPFFEGKPFPSPREECDFIGMCKTIDDREGDADVKKAIANIEQYLMCVDFMKTRYGIKKDDEVS